MGDNAYIARTGDLCELLVHAFGNLAEVDAAVGKLVLVGVGAGKGEQRRDHRSHVVGTVENGCNMLAFLLDRTIGVRE